MIDRHLVADLLVALGGTIGILGTLFCLTEMLP